MSQTPRRSQVTRSTYPEQRTVFTDSVNVRSAALSSQLRDAPPFDQTTRTASDGPRANGSLGFAPRFREQRSTRSVPDTIRPASRVERFPSPNDRLIGRPDLSHEGPRLAIARSEDVEPRGARPTGRPTGCWPRHPIASSPTAAHPPASQIAACPRDG